MLFINAFAEDILLFVYPPGDRAYAAAISDPGLHLGVWADDEVMIPAGSRARLVHPRAPAWLIGIKRAGLGRLQPFILPLSGQPYTARDELELSTSGALIWHTAPRIPAPTPRLSEAELIKPLPAGAGRLIGTGVARITDEAVRDPASALPMQGWAVASQTSLSLELDQNGTEMPLLARAFIIADADSQSRAVIVVADMWSCSIALRQEVIRRISYDNPESPYGAGNILIAGTHTHSGPGGYLHHFLYNASGLGFDPHVFESMCAGIVHAIEAAHSALAPGRVTLMRGRLGGVTRNRSIQAFLANPAGERAAFPEAVDEDVVQLNFEREIARGRYARVGLVNWFAIHPTNLGQQSQVISGDNKGWAAWLTEQDAGKDFIAGFANSSAGDVSGNFERGQPGFTPVMGTDFPEQHQRKLAAATDQAKFALWLLRQRGTELTGPVTALEYRIDLARRCGVPAALGLSMAAGSTEDGGPGAVVEGAVLSDPRNPTLTNLGQMAGGAIFSAVTLAVNRLLASVSALLSPQPLAALLSTVRMPPFTDIAMVRGHFPKPVMLVPGEIRPDPWVPDIIPLQLLRIGSFAVAGIPAEVTTMAGARMQAALRPALGGTGVEHIVISSYTNGYASYLTTPEEYDLQHYEGASTLYGRDSLPVITRALSELADAAVNGTRPGHDAPLRDMRGRVLRKARMTFRNLDARPVQLRLYAAEDRDWLLTLGPWATFSVAPGRDRAVILPPQVALLHAMVQVVAGTQRLSAARPPRQMAFALTSDLVLITGNRLIRTPYFPTDRKR